MFDEEREKEELAKLDYQQMLGELTEYRKSGLSPEEVKQLIVSDESKEQSSIEWFNRAKELQDELNSYKQAEADGRLVEIPTPEESDYKGLKAKYRVFKAKDNTPVGDCFVLRPDKDQAAVAALTAYAKATDNKQLAEDILNWITPDERLVILPCKVGDTVYEPFAGKVYEKTVDRIIINRFTTPQIWIETKLPFATPKLERWDMAFGKTVFLTREEAEKAIAEVGE